MKSQTRRIIIILLFLAGVFVVYHFYNQNLFILRGSKTVYFNKTKTQNDAELEKIINKELREKKGTFAVYIEELKAIPSSWLVQDHSTTTSAALSTSDSGVVATAPPQNDISVSLPLRRYVSNEKEIFPSASLYKLVLLASAMKGMEANKLKLEDTVSGSKSNLTARMGSLDFGYEDMPENLKFSVEEILERIGRISDNFASIMLTDKLRSLDKLSVIPAKAGIQENKNWIPGQARDDNNVDPLIQMAKELGMKNTSFEDIPNTTASDVALFFKKLYRGEVVSKLASDKIIEILALNQINNRIPANLPEDVKVIHKTGELPMLRHDAGLVFPPNFPNSPNHPYLIILLSKDLEFEDDGVETLANISKVVFDYFNKGR